MRVQRLWHCRAPPLSPVFNLCPLSPPEPSVLSSHLVAPPLAIWARASEPTAQVWVGGWGWKLTEGRGEMKRGEGEGGRGAPGAAPQLLQDVFLVIYALDPLIHG